MPQCDDFVTNEVQLCLEDLLQKLNIHNYTIDLSEGSAKGDNFLGIIVKASVKGEDAKGNKAVHNFIIKSAPRNESFRAVASVPSAYDREIYMYKKVLHEFDVLQRERKVKEPFKSYAKYYHSLMNNMNEALIMENMKEHGYELHSRLQPLNYNHTLLILKEYGKLHALSFAMRVHKPKLFKELSENSLESFFSNSENDAIHTGFVQQSEKVLLLIDPIKEKSLYEKYRKFQPKIVDVIKSVIKSDLNNKEFVIGHGDCWINNFLFKYRSLTDHSTPLSVCILDWQLSRQGSPALDLAYFIFACTDKNMRDKHYNTLIEEYYKSFSNFLKELGGDPQSQFSFDTLQKHLKKYCVFGFYMAIMSLLIMTSNTEEIPDIHNVSKAEDVMDQFKYDPKNIEAYNSRVKGILLDFERLGYDL